MFSRMSVSNDGRGNSRSRSCRGSSRCLVSLSCRCLLALLPVLLRPTIGIPFHTSLWFCFVVTLPVVDCLPVEVSSSLQAETSSNDNDVEANYYRLIAVSGGLQSGFPDHRKMHYRDNNDSTKTVKAVLVGRALMRGCKAYLDVMQPGWRQYVSDHVDDPEQQQQQQQQQPLINSVVLVSGCYEHANQYWVYLVDERQMVSILNHEPRFLAITPDTLLVDLMSNETDNAVKYLARHQIENNKNAKLLPVKDYTVVAIPTVVAVHYHDSFVPSPPIRSYYYSYDNDKKEDVTTHVTNFPESLALWAGVNDSDRTASSPSNIQPDVACPHHHHHVKAAEEKKNNNKHDDHDDDDDACVQEAHQRYWNGIRVAIRQAEQQTFRQQDEEEWKRQGPPFRCQKSVRLGTSSEQLRLNYPFSSQELIDLFAAGGYQLDLQAATLVVLRQLEKEEGNCSAHHHPHQPHQSSDYY